MSNSLLTNSNIMNTQTNKIQSRPEEYKIQNDDDQITQEKLMELYHEAGMDKNDLYEIKIRNDIALNLHLSLYKLKRGPLYQNIFKSPCQIKIYPITKLMVIYLIVNHNYLRIKTELQNFKENEELQKKGKVNFRNSLKSFSDSQLSSIKQSNQNEDEINDEQSIEKEIIFTIELIDLFNMLDMLLSDNKDNPIIISIDKDFSFLTGKAVCPDIINSKMIIYELKYNLIKNEIFAYNISNPNKTNLKKNNPKNNNINKNIENQNNKIENNNKNLNNINESSKDNIPQPKIEKVDNRQEESNEDINYNLNNKNYEELDNGFLENKFLTDKNCAKYIIEGSDLIDLYYFLKGLDSLYDNFSSHYIGISICNDKALFFCPNLDNIHKLDNFDIVSKNINQQIKLNIKSVKDHFGTPIRNGLNSFYKTKFISKFITSFYNKDDKRLLIKVSPFGKMILSFTFSDPRNDLNYGMNNNENNEKNLNKNNVLEEMNNNLDNEEDYDDVDNNEKKNKAKIKKNIKDRLLDDENRGNIVEMIFYSDTFDLCKS